MQTSVYQPGRALCKCPVDSRGAVVEKAKAAEAAAKHMAPVVPRDAGRAEAMVAIRREIKGAGVAVQKARMLAAMQRLGCVDTFEAREHLHVPHPAGRVQQLEADGHQVVMTWVKAADEDGRLHRIGSYSLAGTVGVR